MINVKKDEKEKRKFEEKRFKEIVRENPDVVDSGTKAIAIMNNASSHRSKKLGTLDNIQIAYLPPYSPELYPIEKISENMKKHLKNKLLYLIEKLKDAIYKIIDFFTPQTLKNLFFGGSSRMILNQYQCNKMSDNISKISDSTNKVSDNSNKRNVGKYLIALVRYFVENIDCIGISWKMFFVKGI